MKKSKSLVDNNTKTIKWYIYIVSILLGIICVYSGAEIELKCEDDNIWGSIFIGIGTGLLASWTTALFIELYTFFVNNRKNKIIFATTNLNLFNEIISLLTIDSRVIQDCYEKLFGENVFRFERLTLYELLDKLADAARIIKKEISPVILSEESDVEIIKKEKIRLQLREMLYQTNEFDEVMERLKCIQKDIVITNNILVANQICGKGEAVFLKTIVDILVNNKNIFAIGNAFNEIIRCVPQSIFDKLGFSCFTFSNINLPLEYKVI